MMALAHAVLLAVVLGVGGVRGEGAPAPPRSSGPSESVQLPPAPEGTTGDYASSELLNNATVETPSPPNEELQASTPATPRCPAECSCTELQSGTIYTCSLPSGEVEIEETGNNIRFQCTNGTLRASEVPLRGESAGALAEGGSVGVFVAGCALADEPLAALLRRRGPSDASELTLKTPRTPLAAVHVRGLSLRTLRITDLDGAEAELPLGALEALPALRSLALTDGRLVLRGALPALPLRQLELANAQLRSLPRAAFRRLGALRTLSLWRNRFDHIQNDTFLGLESLEQLSLSSNNLSRLPEGLLVPARRLRQLDLYDNRLAFLPRALLAGLDRLEQVRLNDNRENLTLDAGAFANLTSLKSLVLSRSKLTGLPADSFRGCGALQKLLLADNSLHSLPAGLLADLAALQELDLSGNGLAALPAELFAAQASLITLRLDNNHLETLPRSVFRGLSQLKELSLTRNRLRAIESGAFVTAAQLERLYLAHNQLSLEEGAPAGAEAAAGRYRPRLAAVESPFSALHALTHLDLARNRVRAIFDDWRMALVALKKLDLSWNHVSYIDYVSIQFLSPNVEVDLSHNNISTVYLGSESHGSAVITIDGNPFACDCLTPALQAALRGGGRGTAGGGGAPRISAEWAECAAPPALRGTPLLRAPREALRCEVPAPRCPAPCRCHRSVDLMAVDCDSWPPTGRLPLPADFRLNTTHLRLWRVNASLRSLPSHVKKVDLSGLNLTQVPELPPAIEVNLTYNHLPDVPIMVFSNNNNTVRLARNPLDCNCSHEEDVAALLARGPGTVLDYEDLTCSDSTSVRSKQGINLCAGRDLIVHASIGVVVVILLVIVVVLCRRYRYKCLMCIDRLCCCPSHDQEEDRDKDVFLSYAHPDEEWATKLLDFLEGPPHALKVCHHERDWVIGEFIPKQIEWSVRRSRWTVVLLSRHFLASVWGLLEFRVSYIRAHKERRGRILVVLLDDVMSDPQMTSDMRSYVANNTYLHADDPLFFDKLAYALRPRRVAWWRAAPSRAPAPAPAPLDTQLRAALEAKVAADGALANPAFVGPSVADIFTHPQKQHHLDTRKPQVA